MLGERIANVEEDLKLYSGQWRQNSLVENLQGLKGIAFVSSVAIDAEVGDLRRFPTAGKYMKLLMSGKPKNKVCVAVAREPAGFIWSIGQSI